MSGTTSPTFRSSANLPPNTYRASGEIIGPSVYTQPSLKNCRSACSKCFTTSHLSRISTSRGYPVFLREFSPHTQQQMMYKRRRMANMPPTNRPVKAPLTHSESAQIFIQSELPNGHSTAASTDFSFWSKLTPSKKFR